MSARPQTNSANPPPQWRLGPVIRDSVYATTLPPTRVSSVSQSLWRAELAGGSHRADEAGRAKIVSSPKGHHT